MRILIYGIAAAFSVLFLASCEKDDSYPKKVQKVRFEDGKIRMFTNKGEVLNPAIISNFIKRYDDDVYTCFKFHISLDSNFVEYDNCKFDIYLDSKSRARVLNSNGKMREYTLQRQSDELLFVENTSIVSTSRAPEEWYKFKPTIIKEEPTFGGTIIHYKSTIFAYEVNGEIYFPIVSCIATKHPLNSIETGYAKWNLRQNNSISKEYLAKIAATKSSIDTIVFREDRIVFK